MGTSPPPLPAALLTLVALGCPQPPGKGPLDAGACAEGWLVDGDSCVPEACGEGTWGTLAVDDATIYVDGQAGSDGDGSAQAPLGSIQEALDLAGGRGGGLVAVAAGTYAETLAMTTDHAGVRLAGRCRELVTLDASVGEEWIPGIDIDARFGEVELSGLTISGARYIGVLVGSGVVRLSSSSVTGGESYGLAAYNGSSLATASFEVEGCEISGNREVGVLATEAGTRMLLRDSAVQHTLSSEGGGGGHGIEVLEGAELEAEGCALIANRQVGILVVDPDSRATLRDCVVQGTLPDDTGSGGIGVIARDGAVLELESTALRGNMQAGALARDAGTALSLLDCTVEDTLPSANGEEGFGLMVEYGADATAVRSELTGSTEVGVIAFDEGTRVSLQGCTVRDTVPGANGDGGQGIEAQCGAELRAQGCELLQNVGLGLLAAGSGTRVELDHCAIRDTLVDVDGTGARGLEVQDGATLFADGCVVAGDMRVGAQVADPGSELSLVECSFERAVTSEAGQSGFGIGAWGGGSLSARSCLVADQLDVGILASDPGSRVRLWDCEVWDTRPDDEGEGGVGVDVRNGAVLEANGCLIEGSTTLGLRGMDAGTQLALGACSVRNTRSNGIGEYGYGMQIDVGAVLVASRCTVEGNAGVGFVAAGTGSAARLVDCAMLDTQPRPGGEGGYGIDVYGGATLEAEGCDVGGNTAIGIQVAGEGTQVSLADCSVRDTLPDPRGMFGMGIEVWGGALLTVQHGEIARNTGEGILAIEEDTRVVLEGVTIRDTLPDADGNFGYGIETWSGATLALRDCELSDNVSTGILAIDPGTLVEIVDSTIEGTTRGPGVQGAVAQGLIAQDGAVVTATGLEARDGEGPALYANGTDAVLSCTGCTLLDNEFAAAAVVSEGALELTSCTIAGTGQSVNLGGGVGVFAAEQWDWDPPSLILEDSSISEHPIAGAWLTGSGRYQLIGNSFSGGTGLAHGPGTRCGDGVYAARASAWDGTTGLLLEGNTISGNAGAGLFLDNGWAALDGNSWLGGNPDLLVQGDACMSPREDWDEVPAGDVCPEWDEPVCELVFTLSLYVADIDPSLPPPPGRSRRVGVPLAVVPLGVEVEASMDRWGASERVGAAGLLGVGVVRP